MVFDELLWNFSYEKNFILFNILSLSVKERSDGQNVTETFKLILRHNLQMGQIPGTNP